MSAWNHENIGIFVAKMGDTAGIQFSIPLENGNGISIGVILVILFLVSNFGLQLNECH